MGGYRYHGDPTWPWPPGDPRWRFDPNEPELELEPELEPEPEPEPEPVFLLLLLVKCLQLIRQDPPSWRREKLLKRLRIY